MVGLSEAYNNAKNAQRDTLINVGVHGTFGRRLKTQILQDTSASAADPHIDETASKRQRTNDRCTNKSQAAARDERIQRRSPEDMVERGSPLRDREAVVKDVAVDVVDAVESRERDAPAGAHKVQLRRARLPVVEGDHDDARYVRERRVDEELFGRCEELRLDAVRGRAEREEGFGEQEDELLPAVQGWDGISDQTKRKGKGEREGEREERRGWENCHCLRTSTAIRRLRRRTLWLPRHSGDSFFQSRHGRLRQPSGIVQRLGRSALEPSGSFRSIIVITILYAVAEEGSVRLISPNERRNECRSTPWFYFHFFRPGIQRVLRLLVNIV